MELTEPRQEKTCLWGLRPGKTQTSLLCLRIKLESWSFGDCKYRFYTIKAVNNKDVDQTARMPRLICIFVVRIWHKQVLSWCGSTKLGSTSKYKALYYIYSSQFCLHWLWGYTLESEEFMSSCCDICFFANLTIWAAARQNWQNYPCAQQRLRSSA